MNEMFKVKNLENAVEEICRLSKSNWIQMKLIKMENEETEYYLIRCALIHWQFWYDPKTKKVEMERI